MPILKNAQKALRSSLAKAETNRRVKSQVKTALDMVKVKADAKTTAQAFSSLDKALKRNIYTKNKVARIKSQISKLTATAGKTAAKSASTATEKVAKVAKTVKTAKAKTAKSK